MELRNDIARSLFDRFSLQNARLGREPNLGWEIANELLSNILSLPRVVLGLPF
jgi:hypothetical protein